MRTGLLISGGVVVGLLLGIGITAAVAIFIPQGRAVAQGILGCAFDPLLFTSESSSVNTEATIAPLLKDSSLEVPEKIGGDAYQKALNDVVDSFNAIQHYNSIVVTNSFDIQKKVSKRDFSGIVDLLVETKQALSMASTERQHFDTQIEALRRAEESLSDTTVRSLNEDWVIKGRTLSIAYQDYFTAMDIVLSSAPPTSVQVQAAIDTGTTLATRIDEFGKAFDVLIKQFN